MVPFSGLVALIRKLPVYDQLRVCVPVDRVMETPVNRNAQAFGEWRDSGFGFAGLTGSGEALVTDPGAEGVLDVVDANVGGIAGLFHLASERRLRQAADE